MGTREILFGFRTGVAVALIAGLLLQDGAAQRAMPSNCAIPGTRLLVDSPSDASAASSSLISVNPEDGSADRLPVTHPRTVTTALSPGIAIVRDAAGEDHIVRLHDGRTVSVPAVVAVAIQRTRSFASILESSRWVTERTYDGAGLRLRIFDRAQDRVTVDATFPRRIEIAATATSRDGRVVAHLQANNQASELSLFDAETGSRRFLRLPHDAALAAYAMTLVFSRDASCLTVSMTREGALPESWLIDLGQTSLVPTPAGHHVVLAWIALEESGSR